MAASETSSYSETLQQQQLQQQQNEDSENEALIVDCESPRQHGNESPSKLTTVSYLFRLSFIIYSCWSLMIYLNNFIRFFLSLSIRIMCNMWFLFYFIWVVKIFFIATHYKRYQCSTSLKPASKLTPIYAFGISKEVTKCISHNSLHIFLFVLYKVEKKMIIIN